MLSHLHASGVSSVKRIELSEEQVKALGADGILKVEADIFWCLSKLIDDMQDNYTNHQPGVHKILNKMKAVIE